MADLNTPLLPVRLRRKRGEGMGGYLLRLAIANGRPSINALFSTMKISLSSYYDSRSVGEALELWMGGQAKVSSEQVECPEPKILRDTGASGASIYRNTWLRLPRVCVPCLKDGSEVPEYFSEIPFTHCLKHNHPLISRCDRCQDDLCWSEELYNACCPSCGESLESTPALPIPAYVIKQTTGILSAELSDLLTATHAVLFPLDSDLEPRERPKSESVDWVSAVESAYKLLTSESALLGWAQKCVEHRGHLKTLGLDAVFLPIITLQDKLQAAWPLSTASWQKLKDLLNSRKVPAQSTAPIIVSAYQLSDVIGCTLSNLGPLLENSLLNGASNHRSTRDAKIDLTLLSIQMNRLKKCTSGKTIDVDAAEKISHLFGATLGTVLCGILEGKIGISLMDGRSTLLQGAVIQRKELLDYLEQYFRARETELYAMPAVVKITGLQAPEVKQVCLSGTIKLKGWRKGEFYEGSELIHLLDTHIPIRRTAKIYGCKNSVLVSAIQAQGFPAVIEGVLYKRSDALDLWLEQFCPQHLFSYRGDTNE